MPPAPSSHIPPGDPAPLVSTPALDRPRSDVLGLETEYAFLFTPEVGSAPPVQESIYEVLARSLRRYTLCVDAAYRKGGFFLANGGLIHYEAQVGAEQRGLLEMATPECSTALEVVAAQRAAEDLVQGMLGDIQDQLGREGHPGTLRLAKATADTAGHTFGCHENYRVTDPRSPWRQAVLVTVLALYHLLRFPLSAVLVAVYALGALLSMALYAGSLAWVATRGSDLDAPGATTTPRPLVILGRALEVLGRGLFHLKSFEQRNLLPRFSRIVGHLALGRFQERLIPFLVTRLVFTGPGFLRSDRPSRGLEFTLSPKASRIGAVVEVFSDPKTKPILDIKNLFDGPFTPLYRDLRLHVAYSDTTMSEYTTWLKLGTTQLVVRMIEDSEGPTDCVLEDPLVSLDIVDGDIGLGRTLAVSGGPDRSALGIQRVYLAHTRDWVSRRRPDDTDARAILSHWDQVLTALETDPSTLSDRLDWVAKQQLMREAAPAPVRARLDRAMPALTFLEDSRVGLSRLWEDPSEARDTLRRRLGEADGRCLDRLLGSIETAELPGLQRLYYQLRKIDLKYHEISQEGGYHQQLEEAGLMRRMVDPATRARALKVPPLATRAAARGYYVREALRMGLDCVAGWDCVVIPSRYQIVYLPTVDDNVPPVTLEPYESLGPLSTFIRMALFLPKIALPF